MARSLGPVGDAEAADEEHLRGITDAAEAGKPAVLRDLWDAPVNTSAVRDLHDSYFTSETPDEVVAAEMADPAVQDIIDRG